MPRGDGTGPAGMGPMSGRGAGYCAGYSVPGFANPYGGRYLGAGRGAFGGRGRGYRNWYYATGIPGWARNNMGLPAWGGLTGYPAYGEPYLTDIEPEEEVSMLKDEAKLLKKQLNNIQKRIDEFKEGPQEKKK